MKLIDKPLTDLQKKFAELYVINMGTKSNYEIAIESGYSEDGARTRAYELLNPDICPHVVKYINKLKSQMEDKYKVTYNTHIQEMWRLREMAKEKGNVQTAVRAEELRAKATGLHVEKQLIATKSVNNLENLTEEQLEDKMKEINKLYGGIIKDEAE
jgi:phage terminase small subunit|tara:strand:+ start:208 stop:678 length:471 start_codon:yes stop_codon:yes gene_type:complete